MNKYLCTLIDDNLEFFDKEILAADSNQLAGIVERMNCSLYRATLMAIDQYQPKGENDANSNVTSSPERQTPSSQPLPKR